MKKLITTIAAALVLVCAAAQKRPTQAKPISAYAVPEIDFSVLDGMNHPRLLVTPEQMVQMKDAVKNPLNPDFLPLHKAVIRQADKYVKENKTLVYKKDVSGRRILSISRDALARIFACAYAYVTTADAKYLACAEFIINTVCNFQDWNPSHYLDTAEMGLAVSIGYDWLFDVLSPETKTLAAEKLYQYVICSTYFPDDKKKSDKQCSQANNWNQVCNAGVVATSLVLYEKYPEIAQYIIKRAIPRNMRAAEYMYGPDGVYPEGAGYWSYGTNFQIFLNTMLTRVFGTDFGLSEVPGFSKTGRFFMYSQSNIGKKFDYSDTGDGGSTFHEAWYFAERFNDVNCLYLSHKAIQKGKISAKAREFPLYLIFASRYVAPEIPAPVEKVYYGKGSIPIVIARSGWEREDSYLGIKAGYGGYNHGHLDVGSFVFEDGGVRWASEMHTIGGYSVIERLLKQNKLGGLFNSKPDSYRWKIFTYSNRDHSTLTINDKIHDPYATCDFSEVIDEPGRMGGTIDMTKLFGGDVESAVRTVVVKNDHILEVTDVITAPADKAAKICFTLVSDAEAEAGKKAITLSKDENTKVLTVKGVKAKFQTWSTDPKDYPNPVNDGLKAQKGKSKSGYTYTVPAGKTVTVVTTLK